MNNFYNHNSKIAKGCCTVPSKKHTTMKKENKKEIECDCCCVPKENKECDCCCVPGIKDALEQQQDTNVVIVVDSPVFDSFISGRVLDVTCDTVLLGPPIGTVIPPITGTTPGPIARPSRISLCAITFVAAG